MKRIETWRAWSFVGTLAIAALVINSRFGRHYDSRGSNSHPASNPQFTSQARERQLETANESRRAAEDANAERARIIQRYLSPGSYARKAGVKTLAIAVVSENRAFNRSINTAIANRLKTDSVQILSSLFRPEFISDGLFDRAWAPPSDIISTLELPKFLDALLLARQEVHYSTEPSLENVMSANMTLEITVIPVSESAPSENWTFVANGAGFKQTEARLHAEERLIKQLANASKLSLRW